jgi:hypothetical protein
VNIQKKPVGHHKACITGLTHNCLGSSLANNNPNFNFLLGEVIISIATDLDVNIAKLKRKILKSIILDKSGNRTLEHSLHQMTKNDAKNNQKKTIPQNNCKTYLYRRKHA